MNNTFHTKGIVEIRLSLRNFGHSSLDIKKKLRQLFYFDANIILNVHDVLCTFILEHETYTPLEWIGTIEFCLLQYKCEFLGRGIGRSKFQGSHTAVILLSYLPPEKIWKIKVKEGCYTAVALKRKCLHQCIRQYARLTLTFAPGFEFMDVQFLVKYISLDVWSSFFCPLVTIL